MVRLSTLSWGLYLSSSWTWCIGMFLPVILMHRYGWAGYLVFAVPNVIGCAAFGYVMKTPERSKKFVAKYSSLLSAFSLITIAFHFYFIAMLLRLHEVGVAITLACIAVALIVIRVCMGLSTQAFLRLALGTYCLSLVAGAVLFDIDLGIQAAQPWYEAFYLLPLTTIGFLLCPYFDLTFHKALQSAPSRHCFAVFGLTFIPMILITVLYQEFVLRALPLVLILHLGGQALFSMSAHAAELNKQLSAAQRVLVLKIFLALLFVSCALSLSPYQSIQGWLDNYLRFFVFYSVLFPCLLIACALDKKVYGWLIASVLMVLPFLELGVIAPYSYLALIPAALMLAWGRAAAKNAKALMAVA